MQLVWTGKMPIL